MENGITLDSGHFHFFVYFSPQQEVQKIFKAKHSMDTEVTKAKVRQLINVRDTSPLCSQTG